MNSDELSNDDLHDIEMAKERVFDHFESEKRRDPSFGIQDLLSLIPDLVRPFKIDPDQSGFIDGIKAELFKIEACLKAEARQMGASVSIVRMPSDHSVGFEIDEQGKETIPTKIGPFENITKIGSGNFGIVCKASDRRKGQEFALKFPQNKVVASNQLLKMFLNEADHVMKLDHPGIVKTISVETIDGFLFIVQQLVTGTDLQESLNVKRSHRQIAELVAKIADALAYANGKRIVHRDLKPANILLDKDGRPYITDFGMALDENKQLGAPNARCGTRPYMSPEMVAGLTPHLDGRTDIWSLGIIFYELLVQQRPFRGRTEFDIYTAIETNDPRPPRQIDASIPKELQRICLKCLERAKRDRYLTADELAYDLRRWIDDPVTPSVPADAVFVPKGLRSYGQEDSAFFLDLLPGPRDRNNIPASIRFWKSRISEPVAEENRVPIGVIYGPSGSGKSSFVKAGLLPQVKKDVEVIYVESIQATDLDADAPDDTESRIIKRLRKQLGEIPLDADLREIFRGLTLGKWNSTGKKILIILDQFEQRLSQADDYEQSQLAKALRHCDGERLQCLLLIRDDFYLALSRFADALEMDLLEGQNSQTIDLFDRVHARKVLIKLGRAYGRLPEDDSVQLNKHQLEFVDQAIEQLASGNYIICVRLTLFAEMFKSRDWTIAELKSVGGASGVGERFLQETFGAGSSSKRYQMQIESVKAVLNALLPESGSDIRGSMKRESDLVTAAALESNSAKFKDLTKTLDQELRLITRTDPDESGDTAESNGHFRKPMGIQYQLTHDYLVPSIRDWLETNLKKSRRGRARLRLRELAVGAEPGKRPQNVPTNFEFFLWQFYFVRSRLSMNERIIMRYGRRRFYSSLGVMACLILVVSFVVLKDRRDRSAMGAVDDLVGQNFDQAVSNIEQLNSYKKISLVELRKRSHTEDGEKKRRVLLGLYALGDENQDIHRTEILANLLSPDCRPGEIKASTEVLCNTEAEYGLQDYLVNYVQNVNNNPESRFRAAVSLALLGEISTADLDWKRQAGLIADSLVSQPVSTHDLWISALGPIASELEEKFIEMFEKSTESSKAFVLASAIYSFGGADLESRTDRFVEFLLHSNAAQFDAILKVFEQNKDDRLLNALLKFSQIEGEQAVATWAVALLRLEASRPFQNLLSDTTKPGVRSHAIILANSKRIDFQKLRNLYQVEGDDFFRQGVLMTFAEFASDLNHSAQIEWLKETAKRRCLEDQNAGCFAAAELIARRLKLEVEKKWRQERRDASKGKQGITGDVFINSQLQAFSIVKIPNEDGSVSKVAVSMTELTNADWAQMFGLKLPDEIQSNIPVTIFSADRNFGQAYEYCNRLAELDGFSKAYPQTACDGFGFRDFRQDVSSGFGYRFMTKNEWLFIVGGSEESRVKYFGENNHLAESYAWIYRNSAGELKPVGEKLPDRNGLFDLFGNAWEVCVEPNEFQYFEVGESSRLTKKERISTRVYQDFRPVQLIQSDLLVGIRLIRTLPSNRDEK